MTPRDIRDTLAEKLGADIAWVEASPGDPWAMVPAEHWHAACKLAREDEAVFCDFLRAQTGTDYPDDGQIEVVCHLFSYKHRHGIVLKTRVDRDDPKLATVCDVWPAANWYEREIYDLLGVHFDGHPDLRRLVLPDDWVGHPLRKDYKEEDTYQGIPTVRPGYPKFEPGGKKKKKKKKDRPEKKAKEEAPKTEDPEAEVPKAKETEVEAPRAEDPKAEAAPAAATPPPIPKKEGLTSEASPQAPAEDDKDGAPPVDEKPATKPGEGGGES